MNLSLIETREDLLRFAMQVSSLLERGYPVQVMSSPVEGAFMTNAQRGLYYKYLQKISMHTGETVKDLDTQVKMVFYGDPEMTFRQFSIEEFSAFLSQFIPFAEEHFGCLVSQDSQSQYNQVKSTPYKK